MKILKAGCSSLLPKRMEQMHGHVSDGPPQRVTARPEVTSGRVGTGKTQLQKWTVDGALK